MADQAPEEDNRTTEEKIEYLRSRGVQIETPEDRLKGATAFGSTTAPPPEGAKSIKFSYVKVPADTSLPYEEITGEGFEARDCMLTLLKPVFAGGNIDASAAQKAAKSHMGASADLGEKGLSVLGGAAAEGTVETFALVRPAKSNNFQGVYIYLDEVGMLKSLAPNARASGIAQTCGFDGAQFFGDVYISRTQTLPSPMRNVDFSVADMDSSAAWLTRAAMENYDYGLGMREVKDAIEESRPPPSTAGVDKDGEGEGFTWAQTAEDLEIKVQVPAGTKSKDVKVVVKAQEVAITVPDKAPLTMSAPLTCAMGDPDCKLHAKVNASESTWSISKAVLCVMVDKCEESLWEGIH